MVVARYPDQRQAVRATVIQAAGRPSSKKGARERNKALLLGRAAIAAGDHENALILMRAAYPVAENNKVRKIGASFLTVLAHAKFSAGSRYNNEVLGHLASLLDDHPAAHGLYDMTQGYMVPKDHDGDVRN